PRGCARAPGVWRLHPSTLHTEDTMKKTALFLAVMVTLTACKKDESGEYAASDSTPAAAPATVPADTTASATALTDAQIAAIVVAANDVDVKAGEQAKTM